MDEENDIELVLDTAILTNDSTLSDDSFARLRADSDTDLIFVSENERKNKNKNKFECGCEGQIIKYESDVEIKNKLISVFFHIFLMSVFEIFFYFFFIVNIEKELFLEKLMTYNEQLYKNYNENISPEQHVIISNAIYNLFNEKMLEDLKNDYDEDMKEQKILFNMLLNKSIILSTIVGSIFISTIIYGRKEVKINWVLFENILLFLFLGLYEYTFFNMIILKYNPITDGEIKYLFVCNIASTFNIKC